MDEKIEAEFEKWRDDCFWHIPESYPTALLRVAFRAGWEAQETQA